MKNLNIKIAVAFGLAGLLSLLWFGNWMQGSICLLLAGGFGLSDLQYTSGGGSTTTVTLPPVRKYAAVLLILVAIALMGYEIGRDLKKATRRTSEAHFHRSSEISNS